MENLIPTCSFLCMFLAIKFRCGFSGISVIGVIAILKGCVGFMYHNVHFYCVVKTKPGLTVSIIMSLEMKYLKGSNRVITLLIDCSLLTLSSKLFPQFLIKCSET